MADVIPFSILCEGVPTILKIDVQPPWGDYTQEQGDATPSALCRTELLPPPWVLDDIGCEDSESSNRPGESRDYGTTAAGRSSETSIYGGELVGLHSFHGTLQSSHQVRGGEISCCVKHYLQGCSQRACDARDCSNYQNGTVKFKKHPFAKVGSDLMDVKKSPKTPATDTNVPKDSPTVYLSQHPTIENVTKLIHAGAYPKVIVIVYPLNKDLPLEVQVALHFSAGLSYFKMSNPKEARVSFNDCISLCVSMGANGESNIGLCSVYLGDMEFNSQCYLEAATYYKKATQLYSVNNVATRFRIVPPSLSVVHAKCGSALRNASKLVDGVQEYKLAIEKALTDKDRLAANTSLGNLYQSLGENKSALLHYEQSVQLSEKLCDYISLGWAHGNMGNAYLGLFQKDKALHHLQKSMELTVEYEPSPQAIGRTYNNLGTAYQSMGELDKAQEHYDLALSQAIYGDDVPGQARVYGNIGNVLMLRKKYPEAVPHYGEVLRLTKDRSTLSTAHHNRGCAYYEWAESKIEDISISVKASNVIKFYVHGLKMASPLCSPRQITPIAAEYYRHGSSDLQEVVKYHEESLHNIKGSSKGLNLSVSLFETNSRTFHRLQDCLVNLGKYPQALLVAEQSRARTLGELMLSRKGWSLSHLISSPLSMDQVESTVRARSHPVLYLSYTGARLLGWVFVPKDRTVKMSMFEVPLRDDQFEGKSFDHHVRYSLTEALVERSFEMYRGVSYDEESSKPVDYLYELIAKPLLFILGEHLDPADINKIAVISDSYTALLPYSSLRDSKGSGFLGDKISFQLMPSLLTMSVMDQLPDANIVRLPADAQHMCIAGNPTVPQFMYNGDMWNLGKLPHAKQEAEWVAHILKTTPILEEQATKSTILMRIMSAKVIHLATHGSASAGFLAFGAMISVGSNAMVHPESVLLYPEDVEKLNISPALVVLSSCDSGRGAVKADGIQGMARAFILAGAQAVLTTLWRVPDESAAIFMQFFYQYMVVGMESTLALRKAILSVRCFSKYSQYIHWSGYQLTGRDVWFESSTPLSTQILIQRLGPSSAFPRLKAVKELEAALVKDPCFPTDVQILHGCPGVKPSEVVIDFIHNCHQHFLAGVFWISCRSQEFLSASCSYIEKTLKTALNLLTVTETCPALLVFDGMTTLPQSKPLLQLMKNRHTHIVVLYKHYQPVDKLTHAIDHELLRGSHVLTVDPLSMIHSTQRMVYTLQRETDLAPDNRDQEVLEQLAEFTSGSPVLVDITSQQILSRLTTSKSNADTHIEYPIAGASQDSKLDTGHSDMGHSEKGHLYPPKPLEKFADEIFLKATRQFRMYKTESFVMRDISQKMASSVPSVTELNFEQRDEWDTKCQYDSWDSISELIHASDFELEEEILLSCVSIFGSNPIPVSLTTALSSLICKTSGRPHLASSLLQNLMKMGYVGTYPLPVVIHPSFTHPPVSGGPEFVYVPQYISNYLWKHLEDCDKVIALVTSYRGLSNVSTQQCSPFLLGLVSLLMDSYELNYDLMGTSCYREVYRLYLKLLPKSA